MEGHGIRMMAEVFGGMIKTGMFSLVLFIDVDEDVNDAKSDWHTFLRAQNCVKKELCKCKCKRKRHRNFLPQISVK